MADGVGTGSAGIWGLVDGGTVRGGGASGDDGGERGSTAPCTRRRRKRRRKKRDGKGVGRKELPIGRRRARGEQVLSPLSSGCEEKDKGIHDGDDGTREDSTGGEGTGKGIVEDERTTKMATAVTDDVEITNATNKKTKRRRRRRKADGGVKVTKDEGQPVRTTKKTKKKKKSKYNSELTSSLLSSSLSAVLNDTGPTLTRQSANKIREQNHSNDYDNDNDNDTNTNANTNKNKNKNNDRERTTKKTAKRTKKSKIRIVRASVSNNHDNKGNGDDEEQEDYVRPVLHYPSITSLGSGVHVPVGDLQTNTNTKTNEKTKKQGPQRSHRRTKTSKTRTKTGKKKSPNRNRSNTQVERPATTTTTAALTTSDTHHTTPKNTPLPPPSPGHNTRKRRKRTRIAKPKTTVPQPSTTNAATHIAPPDPLRTVTTTPDPHRRAPPSPPAAAPPIAARNKGTKGKRTKRQRRRKAKKDDNDGAHVVRTNVHRTAVRDDGDAQVREDVEDVTDRDARDDVGVERSRGVPQPATTAIRGDGGGAGTLGDVAPEELGDDDHHGSGEEEVRAVLQEDGAVVDVGTGDRVKYDKVDELDETVRDDGGDEADEVDETVNDDDGSDGGDGNEDENELSMTTVVEAASNNANARNEDDHENENENEDEDEANSNCEEEVVAPSSSTNNQFDTIDTPPEDINDNDNDNDNDNENDNDNDNENDNETFLTHIDTSTDTIVSNGAVASDTNTEPIETDNTKIKSDGGLDSSTPHQTHATTTTILNNTDNNPNVIDEPDTVIVSDDDSGADRTGVDTGSSDGSDARDDAYGDGTENDRGGGEASVTTAVEERDVVVEEDDGAVDHGALETTTAAAAAAAAIDTDDNKPSPALFTHEEDSRGLSSEGTDGESSDDGEDLLSGNGERWRTPEDDDGTGSGNSVADDGEECRGDDGDRVVGGGVDDETVQDESSDPDDSDDNDDGAVTTIHNDTTSSVQEELFQNESSSSTDKEDEDEEESSDTRRGGLSTAHHHHRGEESNSVTTEEESEVEEDPTNQNYTHNDNLTMGVLDLGLQNDSDDQGGDTATHSSEATNDDNQSNTYHRSGTGEELVGAAINAKDVHDEEETCQDEETSSGDDKTVDLSVLESTRTTLVDPNHPAELSEVREGNDDTNGQSGVEALDHDNKEDDPSQWSVGGEKSSEEGDLDTDNEESIITDNEMSCQDDDTSDGGSDEEEVGQIENQVDSMATLESGVLDNTGCALDKSEVVNNGGDDDLDDEEVKIIDSSDASDNVADFQLGVDKCATQQLDENNPKELSFRAIHSLDDVLDTNGTDAIETKSEFADRTVGGADRVEAGTYSGADIPSRTQIIGFGRAAGADGEEIEKVETNRTAVDVIGDDDASSESEMKRKEDDKKPSDLKVSVVTWNLAEQLPSEDDASFLKRFRDRADTATVGSDLVMIGSQETENTKPRRTEGRRSRELRRLMIKMLGRNYIPLALHNLGGVQLGLFCKASIVNEIDYVSIADVACGIGNVFHNKGAISAFVRMKARNAEDSSTALFRREKHVNILFVACHLAAHVKNVEARNADYWRIVGELEAHMLGVEKELVGRTKLRHSPSSQFLSPHSLSLSSSASSEGSLSKRKNVVVGDNLMKSMDHIFFCGDLNYRIDLPREVIEQKILEMRSIVESSSQDSDMVTPTTSSTLKEDDEKKHLLGTLRLDLLRHDQLLQMMSEGRAFPDLTEGEIRFPPTFKFDKGSPDMYDTSYKQRIPAWTDRILHRPFGVKVLDYNSVPSATSSDHRPVYGTYLVNMLGRKSNHEKDGDYDGSNNKMRRKTSRKKRNSLKQDNGSRRRTKSFSKSGGKRGSTGSSVGTTVGNRKKRKKRSNR